MVGADIPMQAYEEKKEEMQSRGDTREKDSPPNVNEDPPAKHRKFDLPQLQDPDPSTHSLTDQQSQTSPSLLQLPPSSSSSTPLPSLRVPTLQIPELQQKEQLKEQQPQPPQQLSPRLSLSQQPSPQVQQPEQQLQLQSTSSTTIPQQSTISTTIPQQSEPQPLQHVATEQPTTATMATTTIASPQSEDEMADLSRLAGIAGLADLAQRTQTQGLSAQIGQLVQPVFEQSRSTTQLQRTRYPNGVRPHTAQAQSIDRVEQETRGLTQSTQTQGTQTTHAQQVQHNPLVQQALDRANQRIEEALQRANRRGEEMQSSTWATQKR